MTPEKMLAAVSAEERTGRQDIEQRALHLLVRYLAKSKRREILVEARRDREYAARTSSPTHLHYVYKLELEVALRDLFGRM